MNYVVSLSGPSLFSNGRKDGPPKSHSTAKQGGCISLCSPLAPAHWLEDLRSWPCSGDRLPMSSISFNMANCYGWESCRFLQMIHHLPPEDLKLQSPEYPRPLIHDTQEMVSHVNFCSLNLFWKRPLWSLKTVKFTALCYRNKKLKKIYPWRFTNLQL